MEVLETERLLLRQIVEDNFGDLYRMNSDPNVMKYVGDGSTRNRDQMVKELEMLISQYTRKPGLGIWATILKETDNFVGASGLVY